MTLPNAGLGQQQIPQDCRYMNMPIVLCRERWLIRGHFFFACDGRFEPHLICELLLAAAEYNHDSLFSSLQNTLLHIIV